jgi:hypothetical protein
MRGVTGMNVAAGARMTRTTISIAVVLLALTGTACDEKLGSITGPTPYLEPTLTSIQRHIFGATDSSGRFACITCHSNVGRNPASGLILLDGLAYGALVGVGSRGRPDQTLVIPGDPDNSYLIKKLEGRDIAGSRMPRGDVVLAPGQVLIIRHWIELGAKNN